MSAKSKVQSPKSPNKATGKKRAVHSADSGFRTPHSAFKKARYIMIGGFLGAGKTTSVVKLAHRLTQQGLKVGLITNDQGHDLVDTALLRSHGFATEEIPGGCFCCRFNSLVEAAERLSAENRPEVFIAEPVGSCTDLVATVTYPLRRMYDEAFTVAPLSVLIDPIRALRIFGVEAGGQFSAKVRYIYAKQLEEADIIVINKCDLLDQYRLMRLREVLKTRFQRASIMEVSARNATGLDSWFELITTQDQRVGTAMEIDYQTYGEGEALLGWFNGAVRLHSSESFDANEILLEFAKAIQQSLNGQGAEVAHLKMTLDPDEGLGDVAVVNLVRNDFVPELGQSLDDPVQGGEMIVNLRAEAAPEALLSAVRDGLENCRRTYSQIEFRLEHSEQFRPGQPHPTHRIASLV